MDFINVVAEDVINIVPEHSFTWIFAVSMVFSFAAAFGIGANDVANSFATAIASRTLTLLSACVIASIAEFGGAVLLGNSTSNTIRKGIVDVDLYDARPDLLMLTMFAALVGMSVWLLSATFLGLPVSTTHSIIGAVVGAGIACFGPDSIQWGWDGVGKIIASFVISPAISGGFASVVFILTKYLILIWPNSTRRAIIATPFYAMGTMALVISFWVYKGSPSLELDEKSIGVQLAIIFGCTIFIGAVAIFIAVPWLLKITKAMDAQERTGIKTDGQAENNLDNSVSPMSNPSQSVPNLEVTEEKDGKTLSNIATNGAVNIDNECDDSSPRMKNNYDQWLEIHTHRKDIWESMTSRERVNWVLTTKDGIMFALDSTVLWGVRQDIIHESDESIKKLHAAAFQYRPSTEVTFMWLQVMSSSFMAFSHGANDVANAIAPLATVYAIWNNGASGLDGVASKNEVPVWILAYGGIAIDIGLFLLGWKIVYALGNNITFHSPSRGFSMEMGAVITVLMATFLGIPVSTTHCITGATVAVGLCNGDLQGIHWLQVFKVLFGWVLTLPMAGFVAYCTFALMANAPNREYIGIYIPANSTVVTL
eukprot:CFRG6196T1